MADQELSQDQVLAQLRTRGFEDRTPRTTLRDFWAVLTSITGVMRDGDRGAYLVALYNFDQVEVIESIEPYTSPIGQIEVSASSKAKSAMGYLGKSMDRIVNAGLPEDAPDDQVKSQETLVGQRCHMKYTPGHLIRRPGTDGVWDDIPTSCWELIETGTAPAAAPTPPAPATAAAPAPAAPAPTPAVAGGPGASQQALALLDGKTEQQWHQAVFTDPIIKASVEVTSAIIARTFLAPFELAETVTKDKDSIYHVVKEG